MRAGVAVDVHVAGAVVRESQVRFVDVYRQIEGLGRAGQEQEGMTLGSEEACELASSLENREAQLFLVGR